MKYIKVYEGRKFVNDEHRELYNLSQRLERAINKYFNTDKKSYGYTYVSATYNHKGNGYTVYKEYPIDFSLPIETTINDKPILDPKKVKAFINEADELHFNKRLSSYELTIEQTEELLSDIKLNIIDKRYDEYLMRKNAEKYNL